MRKSISLSVLVAFLALAGSAYASPPARGAMSEPSPTAVPEAINKVNTVFRTSWIYDSPEDVFTNGQVTGRQRWDAGVGNSPDGTGAPVSGLALRLESALTFDSPKAEGLVIQGPPAYEWSFGDLPERSGADAWVELLSDPVPVTFSPGFDASRAADKTEFTSPDRQILTIALTPREVTEGLTVLVLASEDAAVNPVIISPASGEGIHLSPDGHSLQIAPAGLQLDAPLTITVTIQVTPKASKVEYMPYVLIGWSEPVASGITSGSFVSHPLSDLADEIGTWTWSAEGSYQWDWQEELSRQVSWPPTSSGVEGTDETAGPTPGEAGNLVGVHFIDERRYYASGDTFINGEGIGDKAWRALQPTNHPDETGAPVTGLRLTLDSDLAFDGIEKEKLTKMGPPTYEWSFGDLVEEPQRRGWGWDAFVTLERIPSKYRLGLDVSRSFDTTVFSAPGTQTLTITMTPREEWVEGATIFVHTDEDDLVDPVVISYSSTSGGEVQITEGGHRSGIEFVPVELNIPVTVVVTLQVTPKEPSVEYKPYTAILSERYRPGQSRGDSTATTTGSSVSFTNEAGTWTWTADGNYVWQRYDPGLPIVELHFHPHSQVFQPRVAQPVPSPEQAPVPTPPGSADIGWPVTIGAVAGMPILGLVLYIVARRRLRKSRRKQTHSRGRKHD